MFAFLGLLIVLVGAIVSLGASLWFLVETFSESIIWGLACFFLPFVSFAFLIVHWDRAAKPFLLSLAGLAVVFVGQFFVMIGS